MSWTAYGAKFYLCGYVNSRNVVHWGFERLDKVLAKPLHATKVTVWAAMRKGQKLIGPFFFEDDNQATVSVHSETYMKMTLKPF